MPKWQLFEPEYEGEGENVKTTLKPVGEPIEWEPPTIETRTPEPGEEVPRLPGLHITPETSSETEGDA